MMKVVKGEDDNSGGDFAAPNVLASSSDEVSLPQPPSIHFPGKTSEINLRSFSAKKGTHIAPLSQQKAASADDINSRLYEAQTTASSPPARGSRSRRNKQNRSGNDLFAMWGGGTPPGSPATASAAARSSLNGATGGLLMGTVDSSTLPSSNDGLLAFGKDQSTRDDTLSNLDDIRKQQEAIFSAHMNLELSYATVEPEPDFLHSKKFCSKFRDAFHENEKEIDRITGMLGSLSKLLGHGVVTASVPADDNCEVQAKKEEMAEGAVSPSSPAPETAAKPGIKSTGYPSSSY